MPLRLCPGGRSWPAGALGLEAGGSRPGTDPCPLWPQTQQYPPGRSVTEMEVMQFLDRARRLQPSAQALIYLRDSSFLRCLLLPLGLGALPALGRQRGDAGGTGLGERARGPRQPCPGARSLAGGVSGWRAGVMAGGEKRRGLSGVLLGVSSVPDAWKSDFTSESEEAARRIAELKSFLSRQQGVTCRRWAGGGRVLQGDIGGPGPL